MAAPAATDKRTAATPAWLPPKREERAPENGVVPAVLAELVAEDPLVEGFVGVEVATTEEEEGVPLEDADLVPLPLVLFWKRETS